MKKDLFSFLGHASVADVDSLLMTNDYMWRRGGALSTQCGLSLSSGSRHSMYSTWGAWEIISLVTPRLGGNNANSFFTTTQIIWHYELIGVCFRLNDMWFKYWKYFPWYCITPIKRWFTYSYHYHPNIYHLLVKTPKCSRRWGMHESGTQDDGKMICLMMFFPLGLIIHEN